MGRNRKNQPAAVRFGPALKASLICLLIGGSGVGYVWQQNQLLELGRQKVEKEKRLATLRAQNSQLAQHLAELRSPKSLETRVRELNLGLALAQPTQIVRLMDVPRTTSVQPAPAMHQAERQYARRRTATPPRP
jgi:hypothetical protein